MGVPGGRPPRELFRHVSHTPRRQLENGDRNGTAMNRALLLVAVLALAIAPAIAAQSVTLSVNLRTEEATITNTGDSELSLGGWVLRSVTGDQRFTFPSMTLAPGASVVVTSGQNARNDLPRYLQWTRRNVWNNDGDPGELYDASGSLVEKTR